MKPICMAKVGSLNLQRDKAVDNGGLRYGAIESARRPPLPTATPSLRDNPTLLLSIGTQKGPPIGVQKGPLSWRIGNDRAESGRCAGQSRPKPRGGTIAWSSVRSRSQIACNASAVALSCRFLWQGFQPGGIVTLQRGQLGDSVAPTLGATAVIKGSPYPGCRCPRGPSSTTARLALGIGHRSLADRLAWHGPLRSVTSRNPGHETRLRRGS